MTATRTPGEPSSGAVALAHACRATQGRSAGVCEQQPRAGSSRAHQELCGCRYAAACQAWCGRVSGVSGQPGRQRARDVPAALAGRAGGGAGDGAAPALLFGCAGMPGSVLGDAYSATAAAIQAPQMPKTTASSVTHCASVQAAAGACVYNAAKPLQGCAGPSQPPCSAGGCSCASETAPAGAATVSTPSAGETLPARLGLRPMVAATRADA